MASDLLRDAGTNESLYFDLGLPLCTGSAHGPVWMDYRVLVDPVFRQSMRIGVLMIGLPRQSAVSPSFWLIRGLLVLLIVAVGSDVSRRRTSAHGCLRPRLGGHSGCR